MYKRMIGFARPGIRDRPDTVRWFREPQPRAEAICVNCGHAKQLPWQTCSHCGLDPMTDTAILVKSVYLSSGRFNHDEQDSPDRRENYSEELERLGELIQSGREIAYDAEELARLDAQRKLVVEPVPGLYRWFFTTLFLPCCITWASYFLLRYLLD